MSIDGLIGNWYVLPVLTAESLSKYTWNVSLTVSILHLIRKKYFLIIAARVLWQIWGHVVQAIQVIRWCFRSREPANFVKVKVWIWKIWRGKISSDIRALSIFVREREFGQNLSHDREKGWYCRRGLRFWNSWRQQKWKSIKSKRHFRGSWGILNTSSLT